MKYFEQCYVGMNTWKQNMDDINLGFMTPDGDDAAAKKRKKTVDDWCNQYNRGGERRFKTQTFDNVPIKGFVIGDSVTRYRTDNKLFRVYDPRGFYVEISAANLSHLVRNCTLVKGEIQEDLLWLRDNSNNWLDMSTCEEYLTHGETFEPEVGDDMFMMSHGYQTECRYQGKRWAIVVWSTTKRESTHWSNRNMITEYHIKLDKKPYVVLSPINIDESHTWRRRVTLRRSLPTPENMKPFVDPVRNVVEVPEDWCQVDSNSGGYSHRYLLFDSLAEAKAEMELLKQHEPEQIYKSIG